MPGYCPAMRFEHGSESLHVECLAPGVQLALVLFVFLVVEVAE